MSSESTVACRMRHLGPFARTRCSLPNVNFPTKSVVEWTWGMDRSIIFWAFAVDDNVNVFLQRGISLGELLQELVRKLSFSHLVIG